MTLKIIHVFNGLFTWCMFLSRKSMYKYIYSCTCWGERVNLSWQPRALERWLPISFPSVALSLLLTASILNPAFFPSVSQLKVKGGAHSSVRPSTSNRLITSSKRCVYHVNRGPKGPGRTKHPFVREGPQTDKRVGGFSGRWGRRKQITAQCPEWEKSQFRWRQIAVHLNVIRG